MENLDDDDDFGDIYADIEARAVSAFNGVPDFGRVYIEPGDENNQRACFSDGGSDSGVKDVNLTGGDGYNWSGDGGLNEKVSAMETDGSESEDDLNIVLNDDDCQTFPSKGVTTARSGGAVGASDDENGDDYFGLEQESASRNGDRGNVANGSYHHSQFSQYKYVRPNGAVHSSIAKGNGSDGGALFTSMLARGDSEDNKRNQHNGFSSDQVAYPHSSAISGAALSGYGFSLPWYRSILDINIDSFEHKPWRHPGADVTDFFNFGFDEESWKSYCKSLELIRQQTLLRTKIPVYDLKSNQGYEAEFESEKIAREGFGDREVRQLGPFQPKGRAIQVEGSTWERLPSTDVKRLRNRDSDVVIEITVQDSKECSSGSQKGQGGHTGCTGHETSESGGFGVDDNMDVQCLSDEDGRELSMESLERNAARLESKRCPQLQTASHVMIKNSADSGNDEKSDMEGHHCQKNLHTSYGSDKVLETVNNTRKEVGKNAIDAVPSIMESGSSDGDEIEHMSSSSLSGSQSEVSEHGFQNDPEKFLSSTRKSSSKSAADCQECVTSDLYLTKDCKSNDVKMKTGDCENSPLRNNSLFREKQTCGRRLHSVGKTHADNNSARLMSNREGWNQSSIHEMRRKATMHDLGSYDRKDISNHQGNEASLHHHGDRLGSNHVQTSYTKKLHRKDHQSFRDETDPSFQKKWDEQEYFLEERNTRLEKNIVERDWYHHERGLTMKDMGPHTYRESRHIISKYRSYSDKERDTWCRKKDGLHFRKRIGNNDKIFECRHSDGFMQDKERDTWCRKREDLHYRKRIDNDDRIFECGRPDDYMQDKYRSSIPFTGREIDLWDENYERRQTFTGREDFDRRERCASISSLDLHDSMSIQIKDKYWKQDDYQSLSSQSYIDPYTNGGKWHDMSQRDDLCDSKSTELYGRGRRQLCTERCRDNDQFDSYDDAYKHEDRIIYIDDQAHFGKRKYNWQSKELCWAEDELICTHQGDEFFAEAPFYYEKISKHERNYGKQGSANVGIHIDDKHLDSYRCKMTRERSSNGRSSNVVRRDKLEQTGLRYRDPVDLVVGEGKSPGRCLKDESLMCNGKLENMDIKSNRERITFKDFNKSHIWKAAEYNIAETENVHNGGKWLDKFPVTQHNEALDLEEGQIVPEEPDKGVIFERRHTPASAAPTSSAGEKPLEKKSSANGNKAAGEIDSHQILEMRVKMEKRRERFKEPITVKKEHVTGKESNRFPMPQVDSIVDTHENKQRPARKRQWAGS